MAITFGESGRCDCEAGDCAERWNKSLASRRIAVIACHQHSAISLIPPSNTASLPNTQRSLKLTDTVALRGSITLATAISTAMESSYNEFLDLPWSTGRYSA